MLETLAIPVLLKAVEFLFGEGSKILEERRERRKAELNVREEQQPSFPRLTNTRSGDEIQSRETAINQPVLEAAWLDSEAKVRHLLSLLEIYTKRYYLAKEQYGMWGSALVPPIIVHSLTEAENEIAKTTTELQTVLSKVYGKKVAISEAELT